MVFRTYCGSDLYFLWIGAVTFILFYAMIAVLKMIEANERYDDFWDVLIVGLFWVLDLGD